MMRAATSSTAADTPHPAPGTLREAELHRLWLEQRFPPGALTTVAGEPVRVFYRGRPGQGPGPDFRDARISIGGAPPRIGDVELHVTTADFRRHGHADDPAYTRVVLHVVFDAGGETATPLPGGTAAPVLALRPWVERRSAEITAWLERSGAWREPCATACARHGGAAVAAVLETGGERRLRAKALPLREQLALAQPEQVLYRALAGALGLVQNVQPFQMLADRLPIATLLAGLPADDAEAERTLGARLQAAAGFGAAAPALTALPWRLQGLRPNAHPAKRLAGLARLLVRHRHTGLARGLTVALGEGSAALLRALQAPGIGRDRAVEIAVNAVLPFRIAIGEEAQALAVAAELPAAAYGRLALLEETLVSTADEGHARRSLVMANALAQQGALALHREWCCRGGCGVCPLS